MNTVWGRLKTVIIQVPKCTYARMARLCPPESVRGMKVLDKNQFNATFSVPTLKILDIKISAVISKIKKYLLKMDNFRPVQPAKVHEENADADADSNHLLIYMNPNVIKNWSDFNEDDIQTLSKIGACEENFQLRQLNVTYDNWNAEDIFKAVLPADKENFSGYSIIGHIIHVNLRDHLLDYKHLIGQVLINKVKGCGTVVNKTNKIDSTYRNFQMEVLQGEENFLTQVKENKCLFEFDFSKVYWNPRLSTEHERIINMLQSGDVLFDMFAGVGPFSVPSAKKCLVFANDLNPHSFQWLKRNIEINKVATKLKAFNLDGRDFIKDVFFNFITKDHKTYTKWIKEKSKIHVTMNLPAMALTFLDVFPGLLQNAEIIIDDICKLPIIIHVYFFTNDCEKEACQKLVSEHIGFDVNDNIIEVAFVRNVAPNKDMMRVSFNITYNILLNKITSHPEKRKLNDKSVNEPVEKIKALDGETT